MIRHSHLAFYFFLLVILMLWSSAEDNGKSLALVGCTVYTSPDSPPLHDAAIVTSGGRIVNVGKRGEVQIPGDAAAIDCAGRTVVAGFWNSHVHFIESVWNNAETAPAAPLEKHMQEMLTRWGFTTIWDLGSDPSNTLSLRRRVESGEILGPKILIDGDICPQNGHPVYLPPEMQLPEAATPKQAEKMARDDLRMGLDGMKLFTGAFMGEKPVVNMQTAIVKAAADIAHKKGKPVFAHPQNKVGLDNAIAGGADILAHTVPNTEFQYSPEELARFKSQHTALIPTLTLWTTIVKDPLVTDRVVHAGIDQLRAFSSNGGIVLFGTDVGFIPIYDTSQEFEFMHRALALNEVLASLTTNPAAYFKAESKGRLEKGFEADLVVLEGDPAATSAISPKLTTQFAAGRSFTRNK